MLRKIAFLLLIFFVSANGPCADRYYESVYLGEKDTDSYQGPWAPSFSFDDATAEVLSDDWLYYHNYFNEHLNSEFFDLSHQWFNDFTTKSACPDYFLNMNLDYIRYLYRLLTISYLVEGIKDYQETLYHLGLSSKECNLDWNETFKTCQPQSKEMKKFLTRARSAYLKEWDRSAWKKWGKENISKWVAQLEKDIEQGHARGSISKMRIALLCSQKKNCQFKDSKTVLTFLEQSCAQDKQTLQTICSEQDQLFGMSYVQEATDLIGKSNAINVINEGGYALNCLRRYSRLFSVKERRYPYLAPHFVQVKESLEEQKVRYLQGHLFLPGALKEFDDKGLHDFIFVTKKKVKPKKIVEKKPEPKKVVAVAKKEEPLPPPPPPAPEPEPEPIVIPKLSQFEQAVRKIQETGAERVMVNMDLWYQDFVFTDKMIEKLTGPLENYQTRAALEEMKYFDKLGEKAQPLSLIFLKFLIDRNYHQGLFNIIGVLGDDFYVFNDIDEKNSPTLVNLKMGEETNHRWQIAVLNEKKYLEKKEEQERQRQIIERRKQEELERKKKQEERRRKFKK